MQGSHLLIQKWAFKKNPHAIRKRARENWVSYVLCLCSQGTAQMRCSLTLASCQTDQSSLP